MSDTNKNDLDIDLGSAAAVEDFDPFEDDELDDNTPPETTPAQQPKAEAPAAKQANAAAPEPDANPLESAINEAESKEQQSLYEILPVFEYAGATENIEDCYKTFDELRIEKSDDFPELSDSKRVSWTVEYGKITKPVTDPEGISIGRMKSDIELSKAFADSLKKAKDKKPLCKVKPRVTAQSKGTVRAYKGVFTNIDDAEASGKVISIVPARDGKVYEIRNTEMGKFITPINGCDLLSDVQAGFIPALPHIPMDLTMRIVSFFRYFTRHGADREVLVNIYWDKHNREFIVNAPEQIVSKASVHSHISDEYSDKRFIHFMDIHSHNSMRAFFSGIDDNDEKATRLYTVIGRLDKYFPDIRTRISNGGKFYEINSAEVFEIISKPFPQEWKERVRFRDPHGDDDSFAKTLWHMDGEAL